MTKKERLILRKERIFQIQIALSQKAGIAKAVVKKFGKEGFNIIKNELKKDLKQWIQSVVKTHNEKNIKLDIKGLHKFLWEPNKDENIEFTYKYKNNCRTYKVSRCPIAEYAIKNKIADWGYFFYCSTYPFITKNYNQDIIFKRDKTLMKGDECCLFSYTLK